MIIPPISFCLFPLLLNVLLNQPNVVLTKEYNYHVVGQLFCNGAPWQNQLVTLYDEDCGFISPDDHMGESRTDQTGHFEIRGAEEEGFLEFPLPDPYLYTERKCVSNKVII
jgi:hypothetical protein